MNKKTDAMGAPVTKAAREANKVELKKIGDACRQPECRRRALLAYFGEVMPPLMAPQPPQRGASLAAIRAAREVAAAAAAEARRRCCDACAHPRLALAGAAALVLARADNRPMLHQLRRDMQSSSGVDTEFLDNFTFGVPSDIETSDDECGDEDAEDPEMAVAAACAARAAAAGGPAGRLSRTTDALQAAEERMEAKIAAAAAGGGSRARLSAALFGSRSAPPLARAAAPLRAAGTLDEATRAAARAKLAGNAQAAAHAEESILASACYDSSKLITRTGQQDKKVAPNCRSAFVPPRAAVSAAPAPPPPKRPRHDD